MSASPVVIREFTYEHDALLAQAALADDDIPSVIHQAFPMPHSFGPQPFQLAVRSDSVAAALECLGRADSSEESP